MTWQLLRTLPKQQTCSGGILYWHIRDGTVWHQNRKIRRADPDTLEVFQMRGGSGFIARDRHHVYHAWTTLKNTDRASFEHIAANFWRDKNHVYAEHESSLRPIAQADPDTWQLLDNGYARDQNRIYHCDRPLPRGTNPDTWQTLGKGYARDRNRIYWAGNLLPQSDPDTWQILAANPAFSYDAARVYYYGHPIPQADPADWNAERARTADITSIMLAIAQAQTNESAA